MEITKKGIEMKANFWTEEKLNYLIKYYPTESQDKLVSNLGTCYEKIQQKAKSIPVKRVKSALSNIEILLNGSTISFYWLGFLLGDGHFGSNNSIRLFQKTEREFHIKKYCDYIGVSHSKIKNYTGKLCEVAIKNKIVSHGIKNLLGVDNKKTYNPPNIKIFESLTKDQLVALIIGLIDADGYIKSKNQGIVIRKHKNWAELFQFLNKKLYNCFELNETKKSFLVKSGSGFLQQKDYLYSKWDIQGSALLRNLLEFISNNNLPILDEKWTKIQLNELTLLEKSKQKNAQIVKLINSGKKYKEVASLLNISYSSVWKRFKNNNT